MTENIFDTNLKYECVQFWKEFMMWILIMVILLIIFTLIAVIIYCIINFA